MIKKEGKLPQEEEGDDDGRKTIQMRGSDERRLNTLDEKKSQRRFR